MTEELALEAEGETNTAVGLIDLVHETPSPAVRIRADVEGDETVKHASPEDAEDYLESISVGAGENYLPPSSLPDPENFVAENISYSAEAGDTLKYEITITGHPSVGGGKIAMDEEGNEYINGDEDTAYVKGSEITLEAETPADRVDPEDTENFRDAVRVLGGL